MTTSRASVEAMGIARRFVSIVYPRATPDDVREVATPFADAIDALVLSAVEKERKRCIEILDKTPLDSEYEPNVGNFIRDVTNAIRALRPSNAPGAETEGR